MDTTYKKLNVDTIKRIYKKTSVLWSAKYNITFNIQTTGSNESIGEWEKSQLSAEYGDILVVSTANSTHTRTVTCYKWDAPNKTRWSNTVTWPDNSAQYTYADFTVGLADGINVVEGDLTITASCTRTLNSYTITWNYLSAYPDIWTTVSQTYNYGDTPSMESQDTVTSGNARKVFTSWDNLAAVTEDRTITAQYQHQGKLAVTLENCTQTGGDTINEWYPYDTSCSISVKSNTNWAFDSNGTSTFSQSITVPSTQKVSPEYIYVTINNDYCTPDKVTGWHQYNTTCTWSPDPYYSFEEGTIQKSTTENLTIAGGTYSKEPQYIRAASIETGTYNDSVDKNASTYYAANTVVTWTAKDRYYYGPNSSDTTSTNNNTKITAGATITAPNPTYIKCYISGTNCFVNQVHGYSILKVGTVITYSAVHPYSFTEGDTGTTTITKTVTLGTTTYNEAADYIFITVSGTNCKADTSTGYRKLGNTITWTGSTIGTNSKYSFSDTDENAKATDIIVKDIENYDRTASYLWHNVTSVTGTNCSAYTDSTYTTLFTTGWYLAGTKIYWKTSDNAYAMNTANKTTLIEDVKAGNNDRSAVVKQYSFTLTKNANVDSIKVWRTESEYQGAPISTSESPLLSVRGDSDTAIVYYGDVLKGEAKSSTGYHFNSSNNTTSKTYNSGSITGTSSWSPTVSINKYTINLVPPSLPQYTKIDEQWLSLEPNANATHYPVGSTFSYNDTIYAIIRLSSSNGIDTTASGWNEIQDDTYIVGSITATGTGSSFTITAPEAIMYNYSVTISSDAGYEDAYLSINENATTGVASGTYNYGTRVYGFVKVDSAKLIYYNVPSGWEMVATDSNYTYYRVGEIFVYTNSTISYKNWTLKPKLVDIRAPSYVEGKYTSTSKTATSGNKPKTEYARGTTVYGFVAIDTNYFTAPSSWTSVGTNSSGYTCYRVGYVVVDNLVDNNIVTINSGNAIGKAATISFSGNYVEWTINNSRSRVTSTTAYNGDTLSASGSSIICTDQSGTVRWTAIASKLDDMPPNKYKGNPTAYTPVSIVKGNCTVSASGVTKITMLNTPSCSIEYSSNNDALITIKNTNSIPVTPHVSLFNASTNGLIKSYSIDNIDKESSGTVTVKDSDIASTSSVYATAYFDTVDINYERSSLITISQLSAPELVSTSYIKKSDTQHVYQLRLKNPNTVNVTIKYCFSKNGIWYEQSVNKEETVTINHTLDLQAPSVSYEAYCADNGYFNSGHIIGSISSSGGSGGIIQEGTIT